MKFIECQQGTEEWLDARAGLITASEFETAISKLTRASGDKKAGDYSGASDRYLSTIAIERISGAPYGEPVKAWILDRGHELEGYARAAYESRTGRMVLEAGLCITDDGLFGYSTDGFVGDDGMIEVKCPIDTTKIVTMFLTHDVSEYVYQCQGGMWLTGRKWCDLLMYVPALHGVGRDLYVQRILRDDAFIDAMELELLRANKRADNFREILCGLAANDAQGVSFPLPLAA